MEKAKYYYAEARLNGKVALLAGPYIIENQAWFALDKVENLFARDYAIEAVSATLGVASFDRDMGHGRYNHEIKM